MTRSAQAATNQGTDLAPLRPGGADDPGYPPGPPASGGSATVRRAAEAAGALGTVEAERVPTSVSSQTHSVVAEADQDRPSLTPSAATLLADIVRAYLESHDGPGDGADPAPSHESRPRARMG